MIHRRRQDGHKNSAADTLSSDIREKLTSREEPQLAVPGSHLPTLENACSFVQAREPDLFQFLSLLSHSLCHVFLHRPDGSNFMSAGAACAIVVDSPG